MIITPCLKIASQLQLTASSEVCSLTFFVSAEGSPRLAVGCNHLHRGFQVWDLADHLAPPQVLQTSRRDVSGPALDLSVLLLKDRFPLLASYHVSAIVIVIWSLSNEGNHHDVMVLKPTFPGVDSFAMFTSSTGHRHLALGTEIGSLMLWDLDESLLEWQEASDDAIEPHEELDGGLRGSGGIGFLVAFKSSAGVPLLASRSLALAVWNPMSPRNALLRILEIPDSESSDSDTMPKDQEWNYPTPYPLIAFPSAGAMRLAAGTQDYRIAVFNPEIDGPPLHFIRCMYHVGCLATLFTANGDPRLLASGEEVGILSMWDPHDDALLPVGSLTYMRRPFQDLYVWDSISDSSWSGSRVQINEMDMRAWFATFSGQRIRMYALHMSGEETHEKGSVVEATTASDRHGTKRAREVADDGEVNLEADNEDVKIGSAISSQGGDMSIEDAISRIRMTRLGEEQIKEEPCEERLIKCTRLRYSQNTCAKKFRKGPYAGVLLEDAVKDLIEGTLHPERDAWLTLNVIQKEGRLISIDNRRLWCLREYQRRTPSCTVYAKARVRLWEPLFDQVIKHMDSEAGNADISVRL